MDKKADRKIIEYINKIKKIFNLKKAILFGSRARGDNLIDSDYDLILVSPLFKDIFFTQRMVKVSHYWDDPIQLEPFCYTPEEFEKKKKQIGIVSEAIKEGINIPL
mgnify:CR=1 FL=1